MTNIDEFMAAIRQVESGSNYSHPPNASGASGAYQFIDSTWGGYGGFKSAYLAPPDVQDAKARQLMQAYYDQFGDWEHVAAAWIGGPGTAAKGPSAWGNISDANMTVASYVNRVMGATGGQTNIGLGGSKQGNPGMAAPQPQPGDTLGSRLVSATNVTSGAGATSTATPHKSGLATLADSLTAHTAYTQTSQAHGDTLGSRLKTISEMMSGGGPTSA